MQPCRIYQQQQCFAPFCSAEHPAGIPPEDHDGLPNLVCIILLCSCTITRQAKTGNPLPQTTSDQKTEGWNVNTVKCQNSKWWHVFLHCMVFTQKCKAAWKLAVWHEIAVSRKVFGAATHNENSWSWNFIFNVIQQSCAADHVLSSFFRQFRAAAKLHDRV